MTDPKHTSRKLNSMTIQRESVQRLLAAGKISVFMAKWALEQTGHTAEQIKEIIDAA
jgi:hypothetical protein